MIILISGASHTGKTALAQKLLEKYGYPYLSLDHLKMGLIRSGQTALTPSDDRELTPYLWNITKEIIKTAIENRQNLIIEGCYIPFDWKLSFTEEYLEHIRYCCLVMSEQYIESRFSDIRKFANVIEDRLDDSSLSIAWIKKENSYYLEMCEKHNVNYFLIHDGYDQEALINDLEQEIK